MKAYVPMHVFCMTAGRRIAELELHIAIAQMMQNFRVECPETTPVGIVERMPLLIPDRPINLVLADLK